MSEETIKQDVPLELGITKEEFEKINTEVSDKYKKLAEEAAKQAITSIKQDELKTQVSQLQQELNSTKVELERQRLEHQEKMAIVTERLVQRKGTVDNSNPNQPQQQSGKIQIREEDLKREFLKKHNII